jgi:hypothetical protein
MVPSSSGMFRCVCVCVCVIMPWMKELHYYFAMQERLRSEVAKKDVQCQCGFCLTEVRKISNFRESAARGAKALPTTFEFDHEDFRRC